VGEDVYVLRRDARPLKELAVGVAEIDVAGVELPLAFKSKAFDFRHDFLAHLITAAAYTRANCGDAVRGIRAEAIAHLVDRMSRDVERRPLPAGVHGGNGSIPFVSDQYGHAVGGSDVADEAVFRCDERIAVQYAIAQFVLQDMYAHPMGLLRPEDDAVRNADKLADVGGSDAESMFDAGKSREQFRSDDNNHIRVLSDAMTGGLGALFERDSRRPDSGAYMHRPTKVPDEPASEARRDSETSAPGPPVF